MNFSEALQAVGTLHVKVKRRGWVAEEWKEHNIVVDVGKTREAELLAGTSTAAIKYVGVGTGTAAASVLDTGLADCAYTEVTSAEVGNSKAKFTFKVDSKTANGMKISEFGLFAADKVMFSHRVRRGTIDKDDETEIEGDWTIQF